MIVTACSHRAEDDAIYGMMDARCQDVWLSSIDQIYAHSSRYCMRRQALSTLPTVQGCHVACSFINPVWSTPALQRRNNAQLVTTSEPANTIIKAQGPQSRGEATWRAAGVKFDRLCMPS